MNTDELKNGIEVFLTRINADNNNNKINSMLNAELNSCDYDAQTAEFEFPIQPWQFNMDGGSLHGGIIATMFDFSLGILSGAINGLSYNPTVELTTTYMRPIISGDSVIIKAKVINSGKSVTHLMGEAYVKGSDKIVACSKAMFFNKNTMKK